MIIQKKAVRSRAIFAAYQRGESIGELARRHRLSEVSVHQIIRGERHKVAVSVDAYYEEMRAQTSQPQPQAKL
jgi:Mor family transcriptional regulator